MREPPNILEEHLRACVQDQYNLSVVTLEFLHLGLDTRAGVYRVVSAQGVAYLLKAKSGSLYEPSRLVPRYLKDQGIAAVVAPLRTTRGALWTHIGEQGDWVVTLYPFIEGNTGWDPVVATPPVGTVYPSTDGDTGWNLGMTDAQWQAVGTALKQIHQVPLPPEIAQPLRKESFDPTAYSRWVRAFETQHARAEGGSRVERALRARWMEHQPTIHTLLTGLEALAGVLQGRSGPHVICHADLHPGNIIRDHAGQVFVIDWEDVMLAPKERDFLFVGEAPADGSAREGTAPFFQGYGQVEIDWVALTYYRCERVVQDLIECALEVCFREDLGEDTKADAVQLFGDLFAAGNMVAAAWATAAHLPADLDFRTTAGS